MMGAIRGVGASLWQVTFDYENSSVVAESSTDGSTFGPYYSEHVYASACLDHTSGYYVTMSGTQTWCTLWRRVDNSLELFWSDAECVPHHCP
jgi:hypothetical protein